MAWPPHGRSSAPATASTTLPPPYKTRFPTLFRDARRPIREMEDLGDELKEGRYRYLLYDETYGGRSFPQLRFLLELQGAPFRPIFSRLENPGVVIYGVADVSPSPCPGQ